MKPRLLVISEANMDFVQRTDALPEVGKPVHGITYDYVPGGTGATYSITATALGAEAILCARVGNDTNGQRLRALYREMSIDTRFIFSERRAATGLSSVAVTPDGEKHVIHFPGANSFLSSVDVEEAYTALPDAAVMKLLIPERTAISATEFAAKKNIPLIVSAQGARADYPLGKLYPCEVFCPNESELQMYSGIAPSTTENCLRAVIRLSSMVRAKYYVVKMGERGAFLYDGKYYNIVLAHNVQRADTSGSGDIFTAALAVEYAKSRNIMRAVKYANVVAAISISRHGLLDSIPTEDEVQAFIAERGIEL